MPHSLYNIGSGAGFYCVRWCVSLYRCGFQSASFLGFTQGEEGDGGSDEDRRERTEDDAKAHGEGETLDAFATQEQDTEQHEQRWERRVDGTSQRLVDTIVEQAAEILLGMQLHVFANTVEHHHLIVDGVTDNR